MYYPPAEDSYLLEKQVRKYIENLRDKQIKVLDMGSGSGIQAKAALASGINKKNILCADINSDALKELKNMGLRIVYSNLFSNIKNKFDLIIFNPPYLPEDKYDAGLDTTSGKQGNEIIIQFLNDAKDHLKKQGSLLILVSSLSKPKMIRKQAKKMGYTLEKIAEEKLFFEKLEIWKIMFD